MKEIQNTTSTLNRLLLSKNSPKVVITTHHKPDADALGSSLALEAYLQSINIDAKVIVPTDFPPFLDWMPNSQKVVNYETDTEKAHKMVDEADVIFCLDFNSLTRINELGEYVSKANIKKVMIDHHQDPQGFDDFRFYTTQVSSTCELIYHYIISVDGGNHITKDMASCIYAGIMADTGSFKYSNTSADTHKTIAELIKLGVNHTEIHQNLMDNYSLRRYRLMGYVMSQKLQYFPEYKTALITLDEDELKEYNVQTGDTEGFVNFGLGIRGCVFAAMIVDRTKMIKMSFRSKGKFKCNEFSAANFNGGGHFNAAGGASKDSLTDVVAKFKSLLPKYKTELMNS